MKLETQEKKNFSGYQPKKRAGKITAPPKRV
jgi:hypothetical protein